MTQNLAIDGRSGATTMVAIMAVIVVIDNYIFVISQNMSICKFILIRVPLHCPSALYCFLGSWRNATNPNMGGWVPQFFDHYFKDVLLCIIELYAQVAL
tara:strand:+ start:1417 stop:1713 length:297 start_codon:yes stop_codon:yes gene_type:complete